jgi:tetratricopeptide (TPR) repeat protein
MSAVKQSAIICSLLSVLPVVVAPSLADMPPANNLDYLKLKTPEPKTPLEHNNRGVELGMKGKWAQAFKEHEVAIKGEPNNKTFKTNYSSALLRHGDELYKQGSYEAAIPVLKKAIQIDSANKPAADILAKAEEQLKPKPPVKPTKPTKSTDSTKSSK